MVYFLIISALNPRPHNDIIILCRFINGVSDMVVARGWARVRADIRSAVIEVSH